MPLRLGAAAATFGAVDRVYLGQTLAFQAPVTGTPGAPGLTVTNYGTTTATMTWTAPASPGTSAIGGYIVGWVELGGQQRTWSAPYRADSFSLALVNLAPDTDYDFYVEASNDSGPGARTTVRGRTLAAVASSSNLPARVVQGYYPCYYSLRLKDVHPNYNLIMWSFAIGTSLADPGAVKMNFSGNLNNDANTIADVAAKKAAGKVVILSIGGWFDMGGSSFGYLLKTTAHVDRFFATVVPLIERYGFQGIDWDLERDNNYTASAMADASNRLKDRFGEDFIIAASLAGYRNSGTSTPATSGAEQTYGTNTYQSLCLLLGARFDLMAFQLYNNGSNTVAGIKDWANEYIARCGLPDSKWVFGYTTRDPIEPSRGAVTPAFCNDVWDSWRADGREARGSMLWSIGHDEADSPSYRWALEHGGHVLATPAPTSAPGTTPGAPTLASPATSITATGFTSSWTLGTNTTDVLVRRRVTGGSYTTVATVPAGTLTYAHTGLPAATTFEVQLIPRNGSTQGPTSNTVTTATTAAATTTVRYAQDWDGANGTGVASWRARSVVGFTRASSLIRDTTIDAGGGTSPGSLKWTLNADGPWAVEWSGTTAVSPSTPVTVTGWVRNGDTVSRSVEVAFDEFTSAGAYIRTNSGTSVSVGVGGSAELTCTATVSATCALVRPVASGGAGSLSASFWLDRVRITA